MIFVHMPSNLGLVALVMATNNTWLFFLVGGAYALQ